MSPTLSRWTSVACGVIAASALALSTQLPWWSFAEVEVFLTRARHCFEAECQAASMSWMGASIWWHRLATATFGVGLMAAFLALSVAGARAAGRVPRTIAGSLIVAVATGTVCGAATLLLFPKLSDMGTGPGSLLYVLGLITAAVAAGLARRARVAKVDGAAAEGASAPAPAPAPAAAAAPEPAAPPAPEPAAPAASEPTAK